MASYSSGMLNDRVECLKKVQTAGKIGKNSGAVAFESLGYVWANFSYNRGLKSMREAAFDGVDYVVFRMRYKENKEKINRNGYLYHNGVMYMVIEFNANTHDDTLQIKAQETTDKRVIVTPTPAVEPAGTVANDNENNQGV